MTRIPDEPPVVYVVTDLEPVNGTLKATPCPEPESRPQADLWQAGTTALSLFVVPALAFTALLAGLVLGWSPAVVLLAAVVALPVLGNLLDLLGARLGWPPLAWTVARVASRRPAPPDPTDTEKRPTHG